MAPADREEDVVSRHRDEWQEARWLVSKLGPSSNLFTTAIRAIKVDLSGSNGDGKNILRSSTYSTVDRLLKSQTVKSVIYYALLTFCPEKLKGVRYLNGRKLVDILGPEATCAVLAVAYLYRRTKKISTDEDFQRIAPMIQNSADLGGCLGASIPQLGMATGLLVGSLRYIAFGLFQRERVKLYKDYRFRLKQKELPYDLAFEHKNFGCAHPAVVSLILQTFGFGVRDAQAYELAFEQVSHLTDRAKHFRVAAMWLDALMLTGQAPEGTLGDELIIDNQAVLSLERQIKETVSEGSKHNWLSKSKDDINPVDMPLLFSETERILRASEVRTGQEEFDHFDSFAEEGAA